MWFQPDLIWNDGALDFFEDGRPNKNNNNNKMSSNVRSVPDVKTQWATVPVVDYLYTVMTGLCRYDPTVAVVVPRQFHCEHHQQWPVYSTVCSMLHSAEYDTK